MLSVVDAVDEYVDLLNEDREGDGLWHPSEIWGCSRRAIYTARRTPQSNPHGGATRRRFRIGHILHRFVSDALATSPDVASYYPEFRIEAATEEGHGDVLVELEDGTFIVVEVKSTKEAHPKLDDRHSRQVAHYAVHARTRGVWTDVGDRIEPLGDRLIGALVAYIGKDALDVTEYWLPYDVTWEARLAARLEELEQLRAAPGLPPRQTDGKSRKSRACFGCPWLDTCWGGDLSARSRLVRSFS